MLLARIGAIASSGGDAGSFDSIATISPSSSTATIDFTNIPQTYASLHFRIRYQDNSTAGGGAFIQFNNNTGSNYARHVINNLSGGSITASGSTSQTSILLATTPTNASYATVQLLDIHNYTSSTSNKTARWVVGKDTNGLYASNYIQIGSGLWINTAAITSVKFSLFSGTFNTGTSIALYGVKG